MNSFVEGVRSGLEQSTGRTISAGAARTGVLGALALFVLVIWVTWRPEAPRATLRVTAAEWGEAWPYPGFSEGLLWCKARNGYPATFIRLGGQDFGTNGIAYDIPGVIPDRALLKRAVFPAAGVDRAAGNGAQEQMRMAQALCQ